MKNKSVFIAVPNTGLVHMEVMKFVMKIATKSCYDIIFDAPTYKCNENNYMHVAKRFRDSGCDFLLQVDDDNPCTRDPLELVKLDKDVITMPTPTWAYVNDSYRPLQWNVYNKSNSADGRYKMINPGKGLQEADAVGAGCILIAKRVLESPLMRKEAWHRRWSKEDGTAILGLDLAFSERVKSCGFKVFAHWDYPCRHYKTLDMAQISDGFDHWMDAIEETKKPQLIQA